MLRIFNLRIRLSIFYSGPGFRQLLAAYEPDKLFLVEPTLGMEV